MEKDPIRWSENGPALAKIAPRHLEPNDMPFYHWGHWSSYLWFTMSTEAIRNELIDWISKLEDQSLLGSLLGIKKATQHSDWADDISPEERRSIERGLDDLKHGRVTPSKDFWARHGR